MLRQEIGGPVALPVRDWLAELFRVLDCLDASYPIAQPPLTIYPAHIFPISSRLRRRRRQWRYRSRCFARKDSDARFVAQPRVVAQV